MGVGTGSHWRYVSVGLDQHWTHNEQRGCGIATIPTRVDVHSPQQSPERGLHVPRTCVYVLRNIPRCVRLRQPRPSNSSMAIGEDRKNGYLYERELQLSSWTMRNPAQATDKPVVRSDGLALPTRAVVGRVVTSIPMGQDMR